MIALAKTQMPALAKTGQSAPIQGLKVMGIVMMETITVAVNSTEATVVVKMSLQNIVKNANAKIRIIKLEPVTINVGCLNIKAMAIVTTQTTIVGVNMMVVIAALKLLQVAQLSRNIVKIVLVRIRM